MFKVSRMSLRCKKMIFFSIDNNAFMQKFQSRLNWLVYIDACLFEASSTAKKRGKRVTVTKERAASREPRNAQRNENILWMCCHHIFQHKNRSLLRTLWPLLSLVFMLVAVAFLPSIIIPLTWFRNFSAVERFHLRVFEEKRIVAVRA